MRYSRYLLPTLKDAPSDAEIVSHRLMIRAGMIRKVASGIYNLLPLGLRVIRKVERIVREEMDRAGAQEVLLSFVLPSELWKESGRWDEYGKELLRFRDRHKREFCLGPTHEEAITDLVRREVRSYRELPKNLYQIQAKFRDEIRPRFGLMRGREFIMKDAYSFHASDECAEREYENMYRTYSRIFERCGLNFRAVEAETGPIGGKFSHEFMVLADTGEDSIATCRRCTYAANIERAETRRPHPGKREGVKKDTGIKEVSTPGMKTVEEVSSFLGVEPSRLIKTLIYSTDRGTVAVLVRGDHELNDAKLKRALDVKDLTLADEQTIRDVTGAPVGFAGPVGLKIPIYADYSVLEIEDGVTGGNRLDTHIMGVQPERDFRAQYLDIRKVVEGDMCPRCEGRVEIHRGIEVGHIFKLGTKYSESMGATFLDSDGREKPMIMGCYGIGIGRTAAAAIEQNHDASGIIWPPPLAPFEVELIPINIRDKETERVSMDIYRALTDAGIEVLIDDRDERAGVKFKDADLIGIPVRITVSNRTIASGSVEMKRRGEERKWLVKIEDTVREVRSILNRTP